MLETFGIGNSVVRVGADEPLAPEPDGTIGSDGMQPVVKGGRGGMGGGGAGSNGIGGTGGGGTGILLSGGTINSICCDPTFCNDLISKMRGIEEKITGKKKSMMEGI